MIIDDDINSQWTNEINNWYFLVLHNFEASRNKIAEAQEKVETFVNFCSEASVQSVLLEKMTIAEWWDILDAMETCTKVLEKNLRLINIEFQMFEMIMHLPAESMSEMFFDLAEKVIELFISVQIETEDHLKEVEEKSGRFKRVAQMSEN